MFFFLNLVLLHGYCATTIAIIDTGFDLDHDYLGPKVLEHKNQEATIEFHGWDFFDNTHLKTPVIEDDSSLKEILRFRKMKAKGLKKGLTGDEFKWFTQKSADENFMEKVRLFKKHSHGTFVAGIALGRGDDINIFPIRGLVPSSHYTPQITSPSGKNLLTQQTSEELFRLEITESLNRVSSKFDKICDFIAQKKITIVNASYGITYKNMMDKFRDRYKEITGENISEGQLKKTVHEYFEALYERGQRTINRYPEILFIFSAGNSGLNNDEYHHYPSRISLPNTIAVAAMNGEYLATFSNYGKLKVDIGAPGVAIRSLLPKIYSQETNKIYSVSSGTSMSAPFVSNLAAQIKNINPQLSPKEIKKIILETGDAKKHLRGKLSSGSLVSSMRALKAAELSKELNLDQAIGLSHSDLTALDEKR